MTTAAGTRRRSASDSDSNAAAERLEAEYLQAAAGESPQHPPSPALVSDAVSSEMLRVVQLQHQRIEQIAQMLETALQRVDAVLPTMTEGVKLIEQLASEWDAGLEKQAKLTAALVKLYELEEADDKKLF